MVYFNKKFIKKNETFLCQECLKELSSDFHWVRAYETTTTYHLIAICKGCVKSNPMYAKNVEK